MKRLLVLSYYFPPMGMSGVQRTLKFVKYLPAFDWQPVVLTIKTRGSYGYDQELLEEIPDTNISRTFSFDPLYLSPSEHKPGVVTKRSLASFFNRLFIPDNKLGWLPFAVSRGLSIAKKQGIDAIYSSAPPFSSHLAALILKKKLKRPLVCDFRDAWTGNPMAAYASPLHKKLDLSLEHKVLKHADRIIAINQEILDSFITTHPDIGLDKFSILPQGFDPADFEGVEPEKFPKFAIVYTGTFVGKRTPEPLLKALALIRDTQPDIFSDIQVIFAGAYRQQDKDMIRSAGMDKMVEFKGYVPHKESIALLKSADLLWLVIHPSEGNTVATGKLYEYLGAQKPILASVPKGAARDIIIEAGAGQCFYQVEHTPAAAFLASQIMVWQQSKPIDTISPEQMKRYDRRLITQDFSRLLNQLC